jgi:hypothetical protein
LKLLREDQESYFDFASHGGGDQGGAALLQQANQSEQTNGWHRCQAAGMPESQLPDWRVHFVLISAAII